MWRKTPIAMFACLAAMAMAAAAPAQEIVPDDDTAPEAAAPPARPDEPSPGDKLSLEQQQIADRFKRLEELLLRMAELNGPTDPRRAALLKKAVAQSKDKLIGVQFESVVELLHKDELAKAISNQDDIQADLRSLLELLMSENREKQIASEKARIRQYLKDLNQIIKGQKGIQGRTLGGGEPEKLSGEQEQLADKAGNLAKEIDRNEQAASKSREGDAPEGKSAGSAPDSKPGEPGKEKKPGESPGQKPGEKKPGKQPGESQGKPEKPSESTPTPGQGKPSDGSQEGSEPNKKNSSQGQPNQGQPNQSPPQPGEGQSEKDQPPADESPKSPQDSARQRIQNAENRMREAEEKLRQAKRDGASEKQEEAIRELEQAKAQLEEILRQLREEEAVRVLTMLEARFRKMLQMEREVHEGTVRLDKVPQADRDHDHEIQANRLSGRQAEIVLEIDKTLVLLREDGTAVAMPEAVEQIRADMQQVAGLLAQDDVGTLTQGIEEDILAALEELVAAFQKAARDREQGQAPQASSAQAQEAPLVDQLAELKTIRSLQMRVNLRTERYSKLIQGEQTDKPELLKALDDLSQRQERIYRVTRDLEMGKNR